jgi:SAM-dependent methyltransferase
MTESPAHLTGVARLYEESLSKHGTAPLAVGWRDPDSHQLRFGKLASVIADRGAGITVNDLGCGYGAFHEYLVERGIRVAHFRGYDISEKMLEQARARVASGEFIAGSLLDKPADYGFACGIFNVRLQESEESWLTHIERTLDNLNAFSTCGFAFNLLTSYVDFREPHLYYGDPLYFFDFCKRRYAGRVALLHDYPLFEWTIAVTK